MDKRNLTGILVATLIIGVFAGLNAVNASSVKDDAKQIVNFHRAIEGEKFGGVGPGVSPKTALSVVLKVDVDALPRPVIKDFKKAGKSR